ncbi:MAG: hypothetical protein LBH55_02135 [Mycoplasmataceae bacterium]|nr:hypothetical protein [Mycoplasmataceae bacterium]
MNLFIDCTQKNFYLGIFENNSFVDKQIIPTNNNLTDIAIEYIGKLLTKNNLKKTDIKSIYLVLGPGSFTGVRVGILITQSWISIFKDVKCNVISSLELQMQCENCISIIENKSKSFVSVKKDNILVIQPQYLDNIEIEKICEQYINAKIIKNYQNIDIFENVIYNIKNFKLSENIEPLYLKEAL